MGFINQLITGGHHPVVSKNFFQPRLTTGGDIPLPSGKRNLHSELENHHLSWVNQRTQWPFSIAMLNYQRVIAALVL